MKILLGIFSEQQFFFVSFCGLDERSPHSWTLRDSPQQVRCVFVHFAFTTQNLEREARNKVIFYFLLWEKWQKKICGFYCLSSTSFSQDLTSHKICLLHCIKKDKASHFSRAKKENLFRQRRMEKLFFRWKAFWWNKYHVANKVSFILLDGTALTYKNNYITLAHLNAMAWCSNLIPRISRKKSHNYGNPSPLWNTTQISSRHILSKL